MPGRARTLDAVLVELLAVAGGRSVRVVDGRTGSVVAVAGDQASDRPTDGRPGVDDPLAVAALVRDAVALGAGGLDDVTVTTARSVHLLRPSAVPGTFLHLRLDVQHAELDRARRALAAPALHAAVWAVLTADRVPRNAAGSPQRNAGGSVPRNAGGSVPRNAGGGVPRNAGGGVPRNAGGSPPSPEPPAVVPVPRPRAAQQPALAGLVAAPSGRASSQGARATVALAELTEVALPRRRPAPPRRRPVPAGASGLPDRAWAQDADTLRRLLDGLRRLS